MVLLTMCNHPVLPTADDAGDDANALSGLIQVVTLFDMRLQITEVATRLDGGTRSRITGLAQRRA